MRLVANDDSTVLRLDEDAFDRLVDAARGDGAPDPEIDRVLVAGHHDAALTAVLDPRVRLEVVVAGPEIHQRHRGWVDLRAAALLMVLKEGAYQLAPLPPAMLPAAIARAVRLGPRKPSGDREPVEVTAAEMDALTDPDDAGRAAALDRVGAGWAWRVSATWEGGGRALTATDGARGLHVLAGEPARLLPTTPTEVFRWLSVLLPGSDELPGLGDTALPAR